MTELAHLNPDEHIAIVGMAGKFPGANTIEAFWHNLCEGIESISFFSDEELLEAGVRSVLLADPRYVRAKGTLDGIEYFDAAFFGYTPREAEIMDPQHRLFLETAWQALEHAGYDPERYTGRIGLFASATMNTYLYAIKDQVRDVDDFQLMLSNDKDYLSTRVSYKLNLKGPSLNIQTACSSSLVAVSLACQCLLNYQSDMVLAGGVSITVPGKVGYLYQESGIGSPDGHCRAFDVHAQGAVFSNGVGIVVLKRLEEALADGDQIYAVILGSAVNNDGSAKVGYTAPGVLGQARAITEALAVAEVEADSISYIETHGTGTPLGDPIEVAALTQAFRAQTQRRGFCALGSVKSNIGHLDAAAGVAGLIKTSLALFHRKLPPTLHVEQPNPELKLESSPFFLNTHLRPWPQGDTPRRAGVSAFGVGGTNAHVILQEPPELASVKSSLSVHTQKLSSLTEKRDEVKDWHLLPLSARTPAALRQQIVQLAEHLKGHPELSLANISYTLQVGRHPFPVRTCLLASDLTDAIAGLQYTAQEAVTLYEAPERVPSVAFLFPGGGAQHALMGRDLWRYDPLFRKYLEQCIALFIPWLGNDLYPLLTDVPSSLLSLSEQQARLRQTRWGLPALFCVEYALAQRWLDWGVRPIALLGHSLGEYVAACLAGVFSLKDATTLVMQRALLFEQLPEGAMLNVALSEEEVLASLPAELSLAACNTPRSCVVSGPRLAVEAFADTLRAQGHECQLVSIDVAAHSQQVDAILEPFVQQVQKFRLQPPRIPFISNVTGTWITAAQAIDPAYWGQHLRQTVRFARGIQSLVEQKHILLLEVGPGRTLRSLAKQNLASLGVEGERAFSSMRHVSQSQDDCSILLEALGHLWTAGIPLTGQQFVISEKPRQRVPLPTYPFERQRYWIEYRRPVVSNIESTNTLLPTKVGELANWFYLPSWKRSFPPVLDETASFPGNWLIFLDRFGLGSVLAEKLRSLGAQVCIVSAGTQFAILDEQSYQVNPDDPEQYHRLALHLRHQEYIPQYIVHGYSLLGSQDLPSNIQGFQGIQKQGYYSLLWWLQAFEQSGLLTQELVVHVLTDHLYSILPGEPCSPEQALLPALCRVLPQEYISVTSRCFDLVLPADVPIRSDSQLCSQILAELLSGERQPIVAYRGNQRWLPCFESLPRPALHPGEQVLKERGVYLLTGGLGRVGQLLSRYLAKRYRARLALLARTPLPPRIQWSQWLSEHDQYDAISIDLRHILALEEAGAEVLVLQADVSEKEEMQQALEAIYTRFGSLHGVFHIAGVTQGQSISSPLKELDVRSVEEQIAPKVTGLYVLEEVLKELALDFCLLFSSNASVLGGVGFGAYAAANAFMDAFAVSREHLSVFPWVSANWDGWPLSREEEARGVRRIQTSMAQYAMSESEAMEAVERVLALRAGRQIIVSSGALEPRVRLWVERATWTGLQNAQDEKEVMERQLHPRPRLKTEYMAPESDMERQLVEIWQQVLGIAGLGIHDNFFELGGDSVLGLQTIAKAMRAGLRLSISQLFEHQTIATLAEVIQQKDLAVSTPTSFPQEMISQEELEAVIAEFDR